MATPSAFRRTRRRTAAAAGCVAALAGLPAAADAAVGPGELRALATVAAASVAREQALLLVAETAPAASLAAVHQRLADVDAAGVQIGMAARAALAPLSSGSAPDAATYDAGVRELLDLAAGEAPAPVVARRSDGLAMLGVVALTFVALGLTALLCTLRSARPRRELTALAWSDALTGLANRRRLDHDLQELAMGAAAARGRHPASGPTAVIMVDIDHFKDINDRYGHRFGDEVIRAVGALLGREVRRGDVVYRYGGEEFCIVMPGTSDADAARAAARLVESARRLELPRGVCVTLSAGVADGAGVDVDRTLHAADEALLVAKRTGRDRTAVAGAARVPSG